MNQSAAHSLLVNETLLKIGSLPFLRVWKRIVGTFYQVRRDPRGKITEAIAVKIGTPGEPDIDGILTRLDGVGVRLGIEIKTGNAKQTEEQKDYQQMIRSRGGIYIVVRSAQEAFDAVHLSREKICIMS